MQDAYVAHPAQFENEAEMLAYYQSPHEAPHAHVLGIWAILFMTAELVFVIVLDWPHYYSAIAWKLGRRFQQRIIHRNKVNSSRESSSLTADDDDRRSVDAPATPHNCSGDDTTNDHDDTDDRAADAEDQEYMAASRGVNNNYQSQLSVEIELPHNDEC